MTFRSISRTFLCAILLFTSLVRAQTSTGSISGIVEDETGAVIPNATVTVGNVETGVSRSLLTDSSGRYNVPTLMPGHYEIQAQISGFETAIRRGIQLTVGSSLDIKMTLRVGQVAQQTVVTAEAPIVETSNAALSGLVDDRTIRELPLNGRSFDQLISLMASAPVFRGRSGSSAIQGKSAVYSVSGARTRSNMFLIDGTEMLSSGSVTTAPGGALGRNMGVDAVQEFSVLSANYSAAYGKKGGGIINIATRAGTNEFHGSVFEFLRNSVLDARNFFDRTSDPAPFKRNNFGGALGGPIQKERSFFFGNFEALRESLSGTSISVVADANAHQGFLPDRNNPGQLVQVGVAPEVRPFLAALSPLPNGRNFGDGTGEFLSNPKEVSTQEFSLLRFDHRISEAYSFFSRWNINQTKQTQPDFAENFARRDESRDQAATVELKRASARTVHVFRVGFSRGDLIIGDSVLVPGAAAPELKFYSHADYVGQITFSAGSSAAPLSSLGSGTPGNRRFVLNQFDTAYQMYHYRGSHSVQVGLQIQRVQNNTRYIPGDARGNFSFAGLAEFLAGRPASFGGLAPAANDVTKAYRRTYFSSFINDDYKVLPNLTFNLGLRYELFTAPVDANDRMSNYRRQVDSQGFLVLETKPIVGGPLFQENRLGFAPRFGFAWDVSGDGRLAIRGGFGIFYDQIDADYNLISPPNLPFVQSLSVNSPPFPSGFSGAAGTAPVPEADVWDFGIQTPTRFLYSLSIQRQVTTNTVFNIAYVGSNSYHLTRNVEFNTRRPEIGADGTYFYPATNQRLNPALGRTRSVASDAVGNYHSLQFEFVQRLSRGFRHKTSYTFSKGIDDASTTAGSQAPSNPQAPQNSFLRSAERSLTAFHVAHNMAANFTYDFPWKNVSRFSGRLMSGWQVGSIVNVSSGNPFTILAGFNRSRDQSRYTPDRPNLKAGASNLVQGGPDAYFDATAYELQLPGFHGNLGRNTLLGPGFVGVDLTLSKATPINERFNVDFRAEFFNLLNRANFGMPRNQIFASTGSILGTAGRIQDTSSTGRQIQFGLKLTF
jgi:hypothetical protein